MRDSVASHQASDGYPTASGAKGDPTLLPPLIRYREQADIAHVVLRKARGPSVFRRLMGTFSISPGDSSS